MILGIRLSDLEITPASPPLSPAGSVLVHIEATFFRIGVRNFSLLLDQAVTWSWTPVPASILMF